MQRVALSMMRVAQLRLFYTYYDSWLSTGSLGKLFS
jgi:hypothetical protein